MSNDGVRITIGPDASADLVERVRAAFPEAMLGPAAPDPDYTLAAAAAEEAVAGAVTAAREFPTMVSAWWAALDGGGPTVLAFMAAALLGAYAAERALRAAIGARQHPDGPAAFVTRFRRAMAWLVGRLAGIALFSVLATAIFRLGGPWEPATAEFARGVLHAALQMRLTIALVDLLAAPGAPGRRLMGFDADDARLASRAGRLAAGATGALAAAQAAVVAAAGGLPPSVAPLLLLAVARAMVSAGFFVAMARPVRTLLLRQFPEDGTGWRRALAARWVLVYFALILLDLVLRVTGILGLLGGEGRLGAGPSMLVLMVAPLVVAGLRLWRAEMAVADPARVGLFALAEGVVALVAGALLMRAWGVDPFNENATGLARLLPGLVEAAVVAVAGLALWRAAATFLSAPPEGIGRESAEEGGQMGGSRLETALPILRGFVLAVIGVTTMMTALTALGMNIAPLLASAGVMGLAIGFGAQRLVADVISGLFYLYEDAFRVGEYIETGSGKGLVERISIRSVRLRHPRGPVYTIPFSGMGTVQNHSRDWATMKFTFSVPSGIDIEMVRKLVKKTGEEMMNDPELQGKIIAPLKSQGALRIVGRSYEIGCKFTARPGQQFAVRRKAYAALQRALADKGIEFFAPQLTVATGDPMKPVGVAGAPA